MLTESYVPEDTKMETKTDFAINVVEHNKVK